MEREFHGIIDWLAAAVGNYPIPRRVVLAEPPLAASDDLSLIIWLCELISPRGALVLMGTGLGTIGVGAVWGVWGLGRRLVETVASRWGQVRQRITRRDSNPRLTEARARQLTAGAPAQPAHLTDAELQEARLIALHPTEVQPVVLSPRRTAERRTRRRHHERH